MFSACTKGDLLKKRQTAGVMTRVDMAKTDTIARQILKINLEKNSKFPLKYSLSLVI